MSQIHKGIFGSLAVALTLGAVQLAFAHDLIGGRQTTAQATAAAPETGVNRSAKSDRASVPASPGQTQTIVMRHDGVTDTSVLVRMPVAEAVKPTRNNPTPPATKPAEKKMTVACEPPVSVLTDVAKLLQPGRCVT
jgi:hypothetical protein